MQMCLHLIEVESRKPAEVIVLLFGRLVCTQHCDVFRDEGRVPLALGTVGRDCEFLEFEEECRRVIGVLDAGVGDIPGIVFVTDAAVGLLFVEVVLHDCFRAVASELLFVQIAPEIKLLFK